MLRETKLTHREHLQWITSVFQAEAVSCGAEHDTAPPLGVSRCRHSRETPLTDHETLSDRGLRRKALSGEGTPLPEPGPAPREGGSPEGGFPQYVRMLILAEELACRGKESLPGAWEVSHGSLYLELCSGRAGRREG